jgi:HAMP domain-containing protein
VFVCLTAALFVLSFSEQYQHVMSIFSVIDPDMKWELVTNDVFYQNAWRLGILLIGFIAVLLFVVFRLTHRYYGPLVSIERFVDEVTAGEYDKRVTIRNRDELQTLAAKLNMMAEQLQSKHGSRVDGSGQAVDRRSDRSSD